jgi:hypothetical protein
MRFLEREERKYYSTQMLKCSAMRNTSAFNNRINKIVLGIGHVRLTGR